MLRRVVYLFIACLLIFFLVFFFYDPQNKDEHDSSLDHDVDTDQHVQEDEKISEQDPGILEDEGESGQMEETEPTEEEDLLLTEDSLFIVGLGDSLTQGVGDPLHEGYIGILKQQLITELRRPVQLANYAKRGQRSEQLLKRLDRKEVQADLAKADFIFLTIGANDMMKIFQNYIFQLDIPLFLEKSEDYRENLNKVFAEIRAHNVDAPIYMIGIFNPFFAYFSEIVEIEEVIEIWNGSSLIVASTFNNVHFIEIDTLFLTDEQSLLAKDNFHPNREGYAIIAEQLLLYIRAEEDLRF